MEGASPAGSKSPDGSAADPRNQCTDLRSLLSWINTDPQVPEGAWCKDFGSFKLVGEGKYPKTFLSKEQACYGAKI